MAESAHFAQLPVFRPLSTDSGRSTSDTVVQFGAPEVALMARHEMSRDSRPGLRTDHRSNSRKDYLPDSRRADPVSASAFFRMDDMDRHELLRTQQQLQSLVSKVSGQPVPPSSRHSAMLADHSSDGAAAVQPARLLTILGCYLGVALLTIFMSLMTATVTPMIIG